MLLKWLTGENEFGDLITVILRLYTSRLILFCLLCAVFTVPAHASDLPAGFTESVFASGYSSPTAMKFAPDGRLFILEQDGDVYIVQPDGTKITEPFISLNTDNISERGLLGIAFDPNFASNQFVYLYYTVPQTPRFNRVSRFTANGNKAASGSEHPIMNLDKLTAGNHNGGALHFGTDGKLYIAVGDNANSSHSQSLDTRHGKMLRINKDGTIPTDNPFYNTATGDNRAIWAMGLRNPFNFAVQPGTGKIFLNDVGEFTWEEINEGIAGANYGWPTTEGDFNPGTYPNFTRPLYAYNHSGGNCSIIGAAFYNPPTVTFPSDYVGDYFFGDYCGDWISRYDPATDQATEFADNLTGSSLVDIVIGPDGSLYYASRGTGSVYKVSYNAGNTAPDITQHPQDVTVSEGEQAVFNCDAVGSPAPSFKWQRDTVDIAGATGKKYTIPAVKAADNGAKFRCVASNTVGSDTSNSATLTVINNKPPVATIDFPVENATYNAGTYLKYGGKGTDAEDGNLPASAFTWEIVFHHGEHTHPFMPPTTGKKGGEILIPTVGHTETNVWYRVHLTVKDSDGASHHVTRDLLPNKVDLTVQTVPPGLEITVDGQPHIAPFTTESVVGVIRNIGVTSPQTVEDQLYVFHSWSDGGALTHDVSTPNSDTTYTATLTAAVTKELLENGDFEVDSEPNRVPDRWRKVKFKAAKLVCNTDQETVAHGGECAFRTKGVGSTGRLLQVQRPSGYRAGEALELSAWVAADNASEGAKLIAKVFYRNGSVATIKLPLPPGTYDYQNVTSMLTLERKVLKIRVLLKNPTSGGTFWLDDVSLIGHKKSKIIPLPAP